jgi:hypothetical protein
LYEPATKVSPHEDTNTNLGSYYFKTKSMWRPPLLHFLSKCSRITGLLIQIFEVCSSYEIYMSHNLTIKHAMALYNKRFMMFLLLRVCHLGKKSLTKKEITHRNIAKLALTNEFNHFLKPLTND